MVFKSVEQIQNNYDITFSNKLYVLDIFNENHENLNLEDSHILNCLGTYYKIIKKDYDSAEQYYLTSVNLGDSDGMYYLGYFYENREDLDSAEKYYLMSVDLGNSNAMYYLGDFYKKQKNYEKAEKFYLMSVNLCNSNGMYRIGNFYQVKEDYEKAKKYYKMSINLGNSNGMYYLGNFYEGTEDYEKAEKYYLMSSDLGNSKAMHFLGIFYEDKEDYEKAEKYYKMSANLGNSDGMHFLGGFYSDREDYNSAEKYYKMSVDLDNSNAMYFIGNFYFNIHKNIDLGIKYYLMGINLGNNDCLEGLEKLLIQNTNSSIKLNLFEYLDSLENHNKIIKNKILEIVDNSILNEINEKLKTHRSNLFKTLYNKYIINNQEIYKGHKTNFSFIFEDEKYYLHSLVLDSEYFNNLLNSNFKEQYFITIEASDKKIIIKLIKFLYTGELNKNLNIDILEELKDLSEMYLFEELNKICKVLIKYNYLLNK